MKSRCFELSRWVGAQPVCELSSGSNLLLLPRKTASRQLVVMLPWKSSLCLSSSGLAAMTSRNVVPWALQDQELGWKREERRALHRGDAGCFQLSSKFVLPSRVQLRGGLLTSLPRTAAPVFLQDGLQRKNQLWATPVPALMMLHWWTAGGIRWCTSSPSSSVVPCCCLVLTPN